jgi:hypothetical protein
MDDDVISEEQQEEEPRSVEVSIAPVAAASTLPIGGSRESEE